MQIPGDIRRMVLRILIRRAVHVTKFALKLNRLSKNLPFWTFGIIIRAKKNKRTVPTFKHLSDPQ